MEKENIMKNNISKEIKELPVLIDFKSPEVKSVIGILLKDRTTKGNIVWATDAYEELGEKFKKENPMRIYLLDKIDLRPRVQKSLEDQKKRTKSKAEVFTPSWVCNQMNNHCDEVWFGRKNVFNKELDKSWKTNTKKVTFPKGLNWYDYIQSRRLEITCGEAPYIVSRYDTSSGELIPVKDRIGILDRKIRVITENVKEEAMWVSCVIRAYKNTYAYEFQGDNLLLARTNLFLTFIEYMEEVWKHKPTQDQLNMVANIIAKNVWQMDAFTECPPYKDPNETKVDNEGNEIPINNKCKIWDWQSGKDKAIYFEDLKGDNE
jgi:hypothetical protein